MRANMQQVISAVETFSKQTLFSRGKVITVRKTPGGWVAFAEVTVEDESMRRYARTPIVGLWKITLDDTGQVTAFERKGLRESTDLGYSERVEAELEEVEPISAEPSTEAMPSEQEPPKTAPDELALTQQVLGVIASAEEGVKLVEIGDALERPWQGLIPVINDLLQNEEIKKDTKNRYHRLR